VKTEIIRSKILLAAAEGQACVNCGVRDGTVVAAHYQGIRALTFGKGKGIKPHDLCIAFLCRTCHHEFDHGEGSYYKDDYLRKIDLSERFLFCVVMTLIQLVKQGILTVDDVKTMLQLEQENG
jgi:hypothetical protein